MVSVEQWRRGSEIIEAVQVTAGMLAPDSLSTAWPEWAHPYVYWADNACRIDCRCTLAAMSVSVSPGDYVFRRPSGGVDLNTREWHEIHYSRVEDVHAGFSEQRHLF